MSVRRLRFGEWLAALGGVLLLLALFALHVEGPVARAGWFTYVPVHHALLAMAARTGWQALPTLRWFMLVAALLALSLPVSQAMVEGPALPVTLDLIAMLAAGLTTILLAIALATTGASLRFGAIVGLFAAGAATFGAFRAMRTEQGWTPGPERPVEVVRLRG